VNRLLSCGVFCEAEGLHYVIGYATNAALQRATAQALDDLESYHRLYGRREPHVQRFEEVRDYQAGSWPYPRRVVAKVEVTPQGSQRRFVVTNRVLERKVLLEDQPARQSVRRQPGRQVAK
jgi:hypothetical protein